MVQRRRAADVEMAGYAAGGYEVNTLEAALNYHRRGWSIIPIAPGTKKPPKGFRWKGFQTKRPTEDELRGWFGNGSDKGLAVLLGEVSGGLICRDFDRMDAYNAWATSFPKLAVELATVETGRPGGGRHVYFRGNVAQIQRASRGGGRTIDLGDGELRGEGAYCVLPPSRHESGHFYRWRTPPAPGDLPFLDLEEAGFLQSFHATETTERNGENGADGGQPRTTETTEVVEGKLASSTPVNGSVLSVPLCCTDETTQKIERAITLTLPSKPGKRNKQVFELARALKAIPAIRDAPVNELKPYVRRWFNRAKPFITTKAFEETWIDFALAWPKVKFAKGSEPVRLAFDRAVRAGVPEVALQYDGDKCRFLVALCRELQRAAGTETFYLSVRTAGTLLDVDHTTAWRWLFLFESDGILKVVSRGSQATRKASRFRYLAPLDEDPTMNAT